MIDPRQGIGMTSARTRDRLVERLREQGIQSTAVLNQIRKVPRHLFIDEALASRAYEDTALPIGLGQTISQPFVVARMTEALLTEFDGESVLEIGTGCGLPDCRDGAVGEDRSTRLSDCASCCRKHDKDFAISTSTMCSSGPVTAGKAGLNTVLMTA